MKKRVLGVSMAVMVAAQMLAGCGMDSAKTQAPAASDAAGTTAAAQGPAAGEAGVDTSNAELVIKLSNGSNESAPTVQAAINVFKPMVEEKTNGRVKVEVYYGAQIGDDTKATEACRAGELEMVNTSTAPLVGLVPELAIFDIPFLFNGPAEADAVIDGEIGQLLTQKLDEKGLVNLAWNENGFRDLTNSKHTVTKPDDLKGLKIRTMENQFHIEAWEDMGASPTPMSWSEVFTALQQGTIDGQENPIPNFYSARIQEVNKFITCTNHIYSPQLMLYSKAMFEELDPEIQKVLREAGEAYTIAERELNRQQVEELKKALIDEGCEVTELTEEQKQVFRDKTASVWDGVEKKVGAEIIATLKSELEAIR